MSANSKRGFTLVELLVTISIIAILSAIGLVIFSSAQKSGRTAKRIEDLKAIQTALEMYYSVNKSYPNTVGAVGSGAGDWRSECATYGSLPPQDVIQGLVPKYLIAMPADPQMDKTNIKSCYLYRSDGNDYKILAYRISEFSLPDYLSQKNLIDPARDGGNSNWANHPNPPGSCDIAGDNDDIYSWAVYTYDARCW